MVGGNGEEVGRNPNEIMDLFIFPINYIPAI